MRSGALPSRPRASSRAELTPRQADVLELVARGHPTRDIATALGISERAVTAHLTALMAKFGVPNRSGLIAAVLAPRNIGMQVVKQEYARYADAPFLVAVTLGPDHVFAYVNRLWERVMGLRRSDVLGKTVRDVFPRASASTYAARQRAYREGRPSTGQGWHYTWKQADGTVREADFNFIHQPLHDATGQVRGVLLIASESVE